MIWTRRASSARRPAPPLCVERLEDRSVPAATAFTPNAFGGGDFTPFAGFAGQVWSASGDVNGDGVADIIAAEGAGAGSTSEVRVYDGAAARAGQAVLIADFYAYANTAGPSSTPGFAGGVRVAAGDFNGDGSAEVVTTAGTGGNGHVKVFDFRDPASGRFLGSSPTLEASFLAYPGYLGPTSVAALGQGSGRPPLLVTASGAGTTAADVRVFADPSAIGQVPAGGPVPIVAQMFAFPGYLGGVSIAAGDTTGAGTDELFVAPESGRPEVSTFALGAGGAGGMAFVPGITFSTGTGTATGISLGTADLDGTGAADVLTASAGAGSISAFSLATGAAVPVEGLGGFTTGFGFFGGSFLAAGNFFGPAFGDVAPAAQTTTATMSATGTSSTSAAVAGATGTNTGTGSAATGTGTGTASGTGSGSATGGTTTTGSTGSGTGAAATPTT